ncbi:hypothetical protein [Streptomyces sp. NRRL S-646]|uniref:hypothetical protein n=1 Tax=Streptomyces sp. NRRL S-646 TaxID=1463917 RepID=UPI0004C9CA62|nr:hypothetical protein [Streptomyces sp. NRRL S-646]
MTALVGALVFMTAADASAKRKKPKKNESFASFVADYIPSDRFDCYYVEKAGRLTIEDWVCRAGPNGEPKFFSQMVERNADVGSGWDDKGWKYLAAPSSFTCALKSGATARETKDYVCTYKDNNKVRHADLDKTVLATSDQGEKWYLQRLPYPTASTPAP